MSTLKEQKEGDTFTGREAVREADEMTDFFFLMGLNVLQYSKSEASAE